MKILIAEDEPEIAQSLKKFLVEEGYECIIAEDGADALDLALNFVYDVILLDWRMPKLSGLEVAKAIRKAGKKVPIMMVTALTQTSNKVDGLTYVDDYITKPFVLDEVAARIKALLRRSINQSEILEFGDFTLNLLTRKLGKEGKEVRMTEKEFDLLHYFITNRGRILTKEDLAKNVWGLDFLPSSNVIEASIKNLRRKLEEKSTRKIIKSIYGEGYVCIAE